ncbi:hypothetical protein AwPolaro_06530 [Polaromonas sp.]|nr:hypothetical protein AwPolaro_06530 [Polaromonas sp.]
MHTNAIDLWISCFLDLTLLCLLGAVYHARYVSRAVVGHAATGGEQPASRVDWLLDVAR